MFCFYLLFKLLRMYKSEKNFFFILEEHSHLLLKPLKSALHSTSIHRQKENRRRMWTQKSLPLTVVWVPLFLSLFFSHLPSLKRWSPGHSDWVRSQDRFKTSPEKKTGQEANSHGRRRRFIKVKVGEKSLHIVFFSYPRNGFVVCWLLRQGW